MGATYAGILDVQEIFGPIATSDQPEVTGLLRRASNLMRTHAYGLDARILSGETDGQVVTDICVDMVMRVLRNSDGVKQETIGPSSVTYDPTVAAGRLFLMPDELLQLQPVKAARASVGTIRTVPNLAPRHTFVGEGPPSAYGPGYGGEFADTEDSDIVGTRTRIL